MVIDGEGLRGGILDQFKTSVEYSRNGTLDYSLTSSHTDIRRKMKDRHVLFNAYNCRLYCLLCERSITTLYNLNLTFQLIYLKENFFNWKQTRYLKKLQLFIKYFDKCFLNNKQ